MGFDKEIKCLYIYINICKKKVEIVTAVTVQIILKWIIRKWHFGNTNWIEWPSMVSVTRCFRGPMSSMSAGSLLSNLKRNK